MSLEKKIIPNFPNIKIMDIWYNLKVSITNLRKFFWVVWEYREFDSMYSLELLKQGLEGNLNALKYDSQEINKTRLLKIYKLNRALELLNHKLNDDYFERCGYDYSYKIFFNPITDKSLMELVSDETETQKNNNSNAIKVGAKLEKDEWREFMDILHDELDGWWT